MQIGWGLYEKALNLQQQQKIEYSEEEQAYTDYKATLIAARRAYMNLVEVARVAFKRKPGPYDRLELKGKRKTTFAGLMSQMRQFYRVALEDTGIQADLDNFGITIMDLEAGQKQIPDVEIGLDRRDKESGEAQEATKTRDTALDVLNDWVSDYIAITRVALRDRPQLLEKMGIVADSSGDI